MIVVPDAAEGRILYHHVNLAVRGVVCGVMLRDGEALRTQAFGTTAVQLVHRGIVRGCLNEKRTVAGRRLVHPAVLADACQTRGQEGKRNGRAVRLLRNARACARSKVRLALVQINQGAEYINVALVLRAHILDGAPCGLHHAKLYGLVNGLESGALGYRRPAKEISNFTAGLNYGLVALAVCKLLRKIVRYGYSIWIICRSVVAVGFFRGRRRGGFSRLFCRAIRPLLHPFVKILGQPLGRVHVQIYGYAHDRHAAEVGRKAAVPVPCDDGTIPERVHVPTQAALDILAHGAKLIALPAKVSKPFYGGVRHVGTPFFPGRVFFLGHAKRLRGCLFVVRKSRCFLGLLLRCLLFRLLVQLNAKVIPRRLLRRLAYSGKAACLGRNLCGTGKLGEGADKIFLLGVQRHFEEVYCRV